MTLHDEAAQILLRVTNLVRIAQSVDQLIAEDEADAVSPGCPTGDRSSNSHGDPTWRGIRALSPFTKWRRDLVGSLRRIDKAMDDAERDFRRVISESGRRNRAHNAGNEPRCPGYDKDECGNHLETWKDARGVDHIRSTYLCVGCRKAMERAERGVA